MGRWSRGGVSAALTIIARKLTVQVELEKESPRPPAMTLAVRARVAKATTRGGEQKW